MSRTAPRVCWLLTLMWIGSLSESQAQPSNPRIAGHRTSVSVKVTLAQTSGMHGVEERFPLIAIDTLFYIDNQGLTRVLVDLNGHTFKLATSPDEVRQSANAFLIPEDGPITINIADYLLPDDDDPFDDTCEEDVPASGNNCIEIIPQGPEDADAEIIIGDLLLPGQEVAYRVEDLADVPANFALVGNAPNPFGAATLITYDIQENRTTGLPVSLRIYDAAGRRVRTLVDERRYPGRFTVRWDGTGDDGRLVASGVYFCQMIAEGVRETISMVVVR